MKQEHRSLLAVLLSTIVLVVWFALFRPPEKKEAAMENEVRQKNTTQQAVPVDAAKSFPAPTVAILETPMSTEFLDAIFTNDGGRALSWRAKGYETADLARGATTSPGAIGLEFLEANFSFPQSPRYELVRQEPHRLVYRWRSPEAEVTKIITPSSEENYMIDVEVRVTNLSRRALEHRPALLWSGLTPPPTSRGFFSFLRMPDAEARHPVMYIDGGVTREQNIQKLPATTERGGQVYWAGLEDRYFLAAVIARQQSQGIVSRFGSTEQKEGGRAVFAGIVLPKAVVAQGSSTTHTFSVYAGPKEIHHLKAVGTRLEDAIDYGWFTVLAIPMLHLLKFFYSMIHNYGIAIILLTIVVKLLLHPISKKSMKSMKAMQVLQPELKRLQEKFKNDKARLNQETMNLFKRHGANPMGGCLPMLLQFPVYIALYKVLWNSIELYRAPFFWFYRDLSAPDPYFITPILLGLFMVGQQKLMPSPSADPAQRRMMMFMPVMFSAFMLFLPVGLVVYILVNTVISVVQQWMYNHDIRLRDVVRGKLVKV